ncbi:probable serine hydrolase [Ctenocephalides felis]|uniref:probable serine hydrolase n=1 Tax=Ctenocephalides felis TaxID=7515 RepID=UPI000E6E308E|nr:probable serine hydrolase [Ctenocephalides felis]XP_026477011.1 probable serine hydrolase [Ctenocephalides felis]
MPWGHIAGKLWNPHLETRPILAVHGWQDNCNTFNTLAPLLPKHVSLLSIDFPGHGLSSRIPDGLMYSTFELPVVLYRIQQHFGWDKMSLLGHSMGSVTIFLYCCMFPEKVDMAIGLDALKPHIFPPEKFAQMFQKKIQDFVKFDKYNLKDSEPPCYTIEEMIERWHKGTNKSVDKEFCHHLLERSIAPSSSDPEKFYFTRDKRLASMIFAGLNQEIIIALAKNINMPYMAVKAINSPYYEDKKYYYEVLEVLKQNLLFEHHYVEGTHHVHLNEPEKLQTIINDFIIKYRPPV